MPVSLRFLLVLIAAAAIGCGSPLHPSTYDRALGLFEQREFAQAARLLEQTVADAPDHAAAWRYLGQSRYAVGAYTEAIEAYDQAIRLTPEDPQLYLLRSDAYHKLGQEDRAMQDVLKAETFDPRSRQALTFQSGADRRGAAAPEPGVPPATSPAANPERPSDLAGEADDGLIPGIAPVEIPDPTAEPTGNEHRARPGWRDTSGALSAAERLGLLHPGASSDAGERPPQPPQLTPTIPLPGQDQADSPQSGGYGRAPRSGQQAGGSAADGPPAPPTLPGGGRLAHAPADQQPGEDEAPQAAPSQPRPRPILPGTAAPLGATPWGPLPSSGVRPSYGVASPGAYRPPATSWQPPTGVVGGTLSPPWAAGRRAEAGVTARPFQGEYSITPSPESWTGTGSFGGPSYVPAPWPTWHSGLSATTGALEVYPGTADSAMGTEVAEGGYYPNVQVLNDPYGRPRDTFGRPVGSTEPVPTWGDIPPVSWDTAFRQEP